MPCAPHISMYEVMQDGSHKDMGSLLTPDEFLATAYAMSYVQDYLLGIDDPDILDVGEYFESNFVKGERERNKYLDQVFEWYCNVSSQTGTLADQESWKADPKDFEKGSARFLTLFFQADDANISKDTAHFVALFGTFRNIIRDLGEIEVIESFAFKVITTTIKVVTFPVRPFIKKRMPKYINFLDEKENKEKALMALNKIIDQFQLAEEEDRTFCFGKADDPDEKVLDLGDMKLSVSSDGTFTYMNS